MSDSTFSGIQMTAPRIPIGRSSDAEHPTLSTHFLMGIRAMDPAAWQRLVEVFGPVVYRWCRASNVPERDAADVVQDVFATVAKGLENFQRQKESGSFRSWLATITRSRTIDYFRQAAGREAATGGTDALQALHQHAEQLDSTVTTEGVEGILSRRLLQTVEAEFESVTWQAFWSTTIDHQKAGDVAEELGISRASVYQAKSRVLKRLRERLAELPD